MSNIDYKIDPFTGEKFVPKRSNQIFASSNNRIKYNNQRAGQFRKDIEWIIKPTMKNFKILEDLLKNQKENIFHKEYLLGKGYSFDIITHYDSYEENQYPCLLDYMIIKLNSEKIKIRKND